MARKTARKFAPISALILIVAILAPIIYIQNAKAANLNVAMVRIDNMTAGGATTGTVCAKAFSSPGTVGRVAITFPTNWTLGLDATWTTSTTNIGWPTGASAWPTIQASGTKSGQTVTFTSGVLANTTTIYCFNWSLTTALSSWATPANDQLGVLETQTSGGAAIDHSPIAFSTVSNDTISVTGAVNPTFSFSLPTNTDNFTLPI